MYLWMVGWPICCNTWCTNLFKLSIVRSAARAHISFNQIQNVFNRVEIRRFSRPWQNTDVVCFQKLLCCSSGMTWRLSCVRVMFLLAMLLGTRTGRRMSSLYLLAVRPLMTRISEDIVRIDPHGPWYFRIYQICPFPQYKRRCGVLLAGDKLASYRRDFLDLVWCRSQKEHVCAQSALVNMRCRCAHARRAVWCLWFNRMIPLLGRLARRFTSLRRLRTVCGVIGRPWIPIVSLADEVAVSHLFLKLLKAMYRSWPLVVTCYLGLRWRSRTLPVLLNFEQSLRIVVSCRWKIRATLSIHPKAAIHHPLAIKFRFETVEVS